jgi:hypothetical protein
MEGSVTGGKAADWSFYPSCYTVIVKLNFPKCWTEMLSFCHHVVLMWIKTVNYTSLLSSKLNYMIMEVCKQ